MEKARKEMEQVTAEKRSCASFSTPNEDAIKGKIVNSLTKRISLVEKEVNQEAEEEAEEMVKRAPRALEEEEKEMEQLRGQVLQFLSAEFRPLQAFVPTLALQILLDVSRLTSVRKSVQSLLIVRLE
jgi:hypothetical protein